MIVALLALVPALLLVIFVWVENPVGKRPIKSLGLPFAFGIMAVFIAIVVGLLTPTDESFSETLIGAFVVNFLIVAISEEGGKMLGMWLLEKNEKLILPYDALIYGSVIGFGFGAFENCMYLLGVDPLSALLRAFFAVPGHVSYGIIMGSFFAVAVAEGWKGNKRKRNFNLAMAFIIPWSFHGLYDFLLECSFLILPFILMTGAIIWSIALVLIRSKDMDMLMKRPGPGTTAFGTRYVTPPPIQPVPVAPWTLQPAQPSPWAPYTTTQYSPPSQSAPAWQPQQAQYVPAQPYYAYPAAYVPNSMPAPSQQPWGWQAQPQYPAPAPTSAPVPQPWQQPPAAYQQPANQTTAPPQQWPSPPYHPY